MSENSFQGHSQTQEPRLANNVLIDVLTCNVNDEAVKLVYKIRYAKISE